MKLTSQEIYNTVHSRSCKIKKIILSIISAIYTNSGISIFFLPIIFLIILYILHLKHIGDIKNIENLKIKNQQNNYAGFMGRILQFLDTKIGKSFSFSSFVFSTLFSIIYPVLITYLFWTFTGKNFSRVEGYAGDGPLSNLDEVRLIIFYIIMVIFGIIALRTIIYARDKVSKPQNFPLIEYFVIDLLITSILILLIIFFDLPIIYLIANYLILAFLVGSTRDYVFSGSFLVLQNVIGASLVMTTLLIFFDGFQWNIRSIISVVLTFILSAVSQFLKFLLVILLKYIGNNFLKVDINNYKIDAIGSCIILY